MPCGMSLCTRQRKSSEADFQSCNSPTLTNLIGQQVYLFQPGFFTSPAMLILSFIPPLSHYGVTDDYSPEQGQGPVYWDGSCLPGTKANPETGLRRLHDEVHFQYCPFSSY